MEYLLETILGSSLIIGLCEYFKQIFVFVIGVISKLHIKPICILSTWKCDGMEANAKTYNQPQPPKK